MGSKFSSYKQFRRTADGEDESALCAASGPKFSASTPLEAPSCDSELLLEEFKRNPQAKIPVRIQISGDLGHWLEKGKGDISRGERATLVGEVCMNCNYQRYLELVKLPIVKGIYRSKYHRYVLDKDLKQARS